MWDDLVQQVSDPHPFLSHRWLLTWWECFAGTAALRVLVVRKAGTPIAIAPLVERSVRMYGTRVRALELAANDHTPRFDLILTQDPAEACQAIADHLRAHAGEWDLVLLRQVPTSSPALPHLKVLAAACGWPIGVRPADDSPYVPFSGTWSTYTAQLSRNHRSKIRKGFNRIRQLGRVDLEVVSKPEGVPEALDDGLRIEAAAWKARNGTAMSSHPDVRRFYERLADRTAACGTLRLIFLRVAGRRIAFAYALEDRNRLYVLKAGYDPEFARCSPYNLLCALVFEDGFARGLDEYEFLGGNEPWKRDWTTQTRPHCWVYVFNAGARLRALHFLKCRLTPWLTAEARVMRLRHALTGGPQLPQRG